MYESNYAKMELASVASDGMPKRKRIGLPLAGA
jgi:hypothetical protein